MAHDKTMKRLSKLAYCRELIPAQEQEFKALMLLKLDSMSQQIAALERATDPHRLAGYVD